MALTGFDKYNAELEEFEKSPLYWKAYAKLVKLLEKADDPLLSNYFELHLIVSGAQLRQLVRHARCRGVPIASSGKGYWLAKDHTDYESTIKHIEERRNSMGYMLSKMERCFEVDQLRML